MAATEKPPAVHEALADVMADLTGLAKRDFNSAQGGGYSFRGVDAVVNAVGPVLRKNRVIVLPRLLEYHYGEILVGKGRNPMGHARVIVEYTFVGPAGDTLTASAPGEAFDSGDKATAKAMSVALRTALLQSLTLPTDEVTDPDHHTYQRAGQDATAGGVANVPGPDNIDPLTKIKQDLWDWLFVAKIEPQEAVDRYHAKHGIHIKDETDAAKIEAFLEAWKGEGK